MHSNQTSSRYEMCGLERNECERRQRNKGKKKGEEEDPLSHEFLHIAQLINPPIHQQQYHNLAADAVKKRKRERVRERDISLFQ